MNMHVPTLQRSLSDVVAEYDMKAAAVEEAIKAFNAAGAAINLASGIGGTYGRTQINTGSVCDRTMKESLLKSAWFHVYGGLNIERICSADDKRRFTQAMEKPAPFTLENIRATFGKFILDPRGNILRALAECFCQLDPAYKSHDKVKIGVAGLPKRVIIGYVGGYSTSGKDKIENILNALAAYQGKPLVEYNEINALLAHEDALLEGGKKPYGYRGEMINVVARGVRLKRFKNGNGHLIFEPATLRDINMALAEYYGDVLADTTEEKPTAKRSSTAVSKDLQYYPTPAKVVDSVVADLYPIKGQKVLEPSCGCGRFMDALRKAGADVMGIEVDLRRATESRAKGHPVVCANFLETTPTANYDRVVMNPPFYGKHYAKHVQHALKFLKPGGVLTAILPVTARDDHGLLHGKWSDLPVGSFSESGTNINTVILKIVVDA